MQFLLETGRDDKRQLMAANFMKPIEILLVEDNPGDVDLTREALEGNKLRNNLHVVSDGEAAMAFLRHEGKYAGVPRPGLVLLDLNLPNKHGREVLAEMKADDSLKRIPVVVLTTSQAEEDIHKSYNLHANCYITKPIELGHFIKVVQAIENFWLTIVELPLNGVKK
jgi:two-component system response regulator